MIDTWRKDGEKVREESRMFLEIKVECFVVNLKIRSLDDDLFEGIMFLMLADS